MMNIVKDIPVHFHVDFKHAPKGEISRYWLHIVSNGLGVPIMIPLLVARGDEDGPVIGINAALHGNELNGISVIQRLFAELNPMEIRGTVVGIPVMNIPAFMNNERRFIDGVDLNRIMPGDPNGNVSEVYANRFVERVLSQFDYLIDLHTASFGRINSYYIRANMNDPVTRRMALLQNAQIVVNNHGTDNTLRGVAMNMGIPAITLEVGDPNQFQKGVIRSGLTGIFNVLTDLGIVEDHEIEDPHEPAVLCKSSYWLYTDKGGMLDVFPRITEKVRKGDKIARIRNVFGDLIKEYFAPEDGIVIGKSTQPVGQTGARILHLGIME